MGVRTAPARADLERANEPARARAARYTPLAVGVGALMVLSALGAGLLAGPAVPLGPHLATVLSPTAPSPAARAAPFSAPLSSSARAAGPPVQGGYRSPSPASPGSSSPGLTYTESSLFETNNTLVAGNVAYSNFGDGPTGFAYDPSSGLLYVTDFDSSNVSVVNESTGVILENIPVGENPALATYVAASQDVYVADYGATNLTVISTVTNRVVAQIPVGLYPFGLAYVPRHSTLFVSNQYSGNVSLINTTTNRVIGNVSLGAASYPAGLAYDPVRDTVIVALEYGNNSYFGAGYGNLTVISASTDRIVGSVSQTTSNLPIWPAYDPVTQAIYVTLGAYYSYASVGLVNASTYAYTPTALALGDPFIIAYGPVTEEMYISDPAYDVVYVVNGTTLVTELAVGVEPEQVGYVSAGFSMFTANMGSDNLTVISTRSASVTRNLLLGTDWEAVVYDPLTQLLYVANYTGNSVVVLSPRTNRIVDLIPVDAGPTSLAVDTSNGALYVVCAGAGTIDEINTTVNAVAVSAYLYPSGWTLFDNYYIAYDPVSDLLDVVGVGVNTTAFAYLLMTVDPTALVVTGVVANVALAPDGLVAEGAAQLAWVTDGLSNTVVGVDIANDSIAATVPVGSEPEGLDLALPFGQLFVANSNSSDVSAIALANDSVVATIGVGSVPYSVTFADAAQATLWVTDAGSNNLTVLNPLFDSVIGTVPSGFEPFAAAFDPSTSTLYALNAASDSVTIVSEITYHAYAAEFTETGLPGGTPWSVEIGSATISSTSSTLTVGDLLNGSYSYTIVENGSYVAVPETGTFTIHGGSVTVPVSFEAAYPATFTESGLPLGATWYVNVTGEPSLSATVGSGTGTTLTLELTNASYAYLVATNERSWYPSSPHGTFMIAGAAKAIAAPFDLRTYSIGFTESGLPNGVTWYVNVSGQPSASATVGGGSGTSLTIPLANGSYTYRVAANQKNWTTLSGGSLSVSGAPSSLSVVFSAVNFVVSFDESGLPDGAVWYVNLSGRPSLSATVNGLEGTTIEAELTSGTYAYGLATNEKSWATNATGELSVTTAPITVSVVFTEVTYSVTFTETGLPKGTAWTVTLDGTPYSEPVGQPIVGYAPNGSTPWSVEPVPGYHLTDAAYSGVLTVSGAPIDAPALPFAQTTYTVTFTPANLSAGTTWNLTVSETSGPLEWNGSAVDAPLTFSLPNGTFRYAIEAIPGLSIATGWKGTFTVGAASVSRTVKFATFTFAITFEEGGLPYGLSWEVTLGETSTTTLGASITFVEPNGTYAFSVTSLASGWSPSPASGSIDVKGSAPAPTDVVFASSSSSPALSSVWIWAGVGAAVLVLVIVLALLLVRRRPARPMTEYQEPPESAAPTEPAPPSPTMEDESTSASFPR